MKKREGFSPALYLLFFLVTAAVLLVCVSAGSVRVPITDTAKAILSFITAQPVPSGLSGSIILNVRLPRVLCAALIGASLSLCGAVMQGLLRNPLADGSTLGISSGASIGAVLALAFGFRLPGFAAGGVTFTAIVFAFASLMVILTLAYSLDFSLSTNTILLIGVIFSMFAGSIVSLVVTFADDKVKSVVFWLMGSLSGSSYKNARLLFVALAVCGAVALRFSRELNAFAIGEDNARNVGVNVRLVKQTLLIAVSVLIGIAVSIGGAINFVGLVVPHMTRMLTGPNHKRLLPASIFSGAVFLMLADLFSRLVLNPRELPIGVVTSFVGSIVFVYIFYMSRKGRA